MAQQGLFTQGTSVQDLMADRRQRGTDLQNMLMQQAAQGARNPVRAQGASMLGSILGRSLAGAMGGQDTEMEKLTDKNAQLASDSQSYGTAALGGSAAMKAEALRLQETNPRAALAMTELYRKQLAVEETKNTDDTGSTKKQVSGAYLNASQGTTNYEPTAMFSLDSKTGAVTPIGRTGKQEDEANITIKAQEIEEAYGFKQGTKEHKELFQQSLNIGESLSISDIKSVTEGWDKTTQSETERISTATELLGLLDQEGSGIVEAQQVSIIADRLVSRLFGGSDTKAQAEINAFRSTGSVGNRLAKSATMFLSGVYNKDTLEGFKQLANFSLNNNIDSYNGKLEVAIKRSSMAKNLNVEQATALFGKPKELPTIDQNKEVNTGVTTVVSGITYRFVGGDQNNPDNWVEVGD